MPLSMTGYGRSEATVAGHRAVVEIRSVNHRFADFSLRLPRRYGQLEEPVRALLLERVARGRVDLHLVVEPVGGGSREVRVDLELAAAHARALTDLGRRLRLRGRPRLETIAALPDVVVAAEPVMDPQAAWPAVRQAVVEAREQLVEMRRREGDRLYQDITHRLGRLGQLIEEVKARAPLAAEEQRQRLAQRVAELGRGVELDQARLASEIALVVEKAGITEELVRVGSHLQEAARALGERVPVGRRLEFIAQEIGRELNTAAAKTGDLQVGKLLVDAREELEKVREQVQNIE